MPAVIGSPKEFRLLWEQQRMGLGGTALALFHDDR